MNTKLTLNVDNKIISEAKQYANMRNESLSKLVEKFLKAISQTKIQSKKRTPIVEELSGCVKLNNIDNYKDDYADYLSEKYL